VNHPDGLSDALNFPLVDAILGRRSRRFGLGMELPSGAMAYRSEHPPIPLTELEEAMLAWMGTGLTGLALGDLPSDGLSWMFGWAGRAWPSSCNSHSTELLFTNDDGLFALSLADWLPAESEIALLAEKPRDAQIAGLLRMYRERCRKLSDGRADLPKGEPGLFKFNAWNANQPGSTLFVPVTNTTVEYLTLLFIYFDEEHRFCIVDELDGDSACGLEPWLKTGRIRRDVEMSLTDLEMRVLTSLNVEQAFICQNMTLGLQALGLGGWTFTGFLPHHLLGGADYCDGLGFRFVTPEQSVRRRPAPTPVGRDGVIEGLCPPYVANMREAVERFLEGQTADLSRPSPYRDPAGVMTGRPQPTDETVDIVVAFCEHVHSKYGRFPAYIDPMFVRLVVQAHHLDLDFYDRHYGPGAYGASHRDHMERWHPTR
jgi:hypothetical protein